ncbi:NUDIX hydrolase [Planosporangium thailandense]|uniref:NUDIX hydrolase n=1 Tax=Planosporangium thailandense TaxID=765197 RepID=A0ABX0XTE8_9ACTN|nr:NUDIX hydrolase [Planosporangium thailandense]NJC69270.1 NUDIX hydrolase [Planosporangium thailandense]
MPDGLLEHVRRFYASGAAPVTPKYASTVLLLREGEPGLEVYLIRRASTMAFAAGMHAFPGGTVDPRDTEVQPAWTGPTPAEWATRLGLSEPLARAVVSAAVREVFEECGVLLAGPDAGTVVGDVSGEEWESARLALIAREVGFAELLAERGLVVRSDLLTPWARWLTPEFEPRRYDTYFFLARLPERQVTRDVGGEAEHVVWGRPEDLVNLRMLPPTVAALRGLTAYRSVDAAMAAERDVTTAVMPRADLDSDPVRLLID